jgi:DDE superfamily endonuclease
MTARQPCPPAPGPLEAFAMRFDPLFGSLGQRRSFRGYLSGLLAPRDRNKTLTALAGAEPVVQAQSPEVQRLQYFLSEADWSAEALNARRLALLQGAAATAAHRGGHRGPPRRRARARRHRRSEGRHRHRACRPAISRLGRQDRQWHRRRHLPLDRRAGALPPARRPLHAGISLRRWHEGSALPHQAADRHRPHRAGARRRHPLPRRRHRLLLRGQP